MGEQAKQDGNVPSTVRNVLDGSASSSTRLSSARKERDLTLGGVQKKTFKPKIPAKKTAAEILESQRQPAAENVPPSGRPTAKGRGDPGKGRGRGRGRGAKRGRPTVVETSSIFATGSCENTNRRTAAAGWSRGGGSSAGGHSFNVKREPGRGGQGVKEEGGFGLDGDDDYKSMFGDEAENAEEDQDDYLAPVQLPLTQLTLAEPEVTPAALFTRPMSEDQEELVFIQLPDTFPATLLAAAAAAEGQEATEAKKFVTLDSMPEGRIGKLQIRKSGRVEIIVGGNALDVSSGSRRPCMQEAVTIRAAAEVSDSSEAPPGVFFLGAVHHHLVCTPNYETLLNGN